jgi:hypothetical protein
MRARVVPIIGVMLLACLHDSAKAADPSKKADEHRIRVLVELLASKNKPPKSYPFPASYDKNAQVIVYLAIQQLLAEGSVGFDTLIGHFNDTRYSYTFALPDDECPETVGMVCQSIMWRCIECYGNEIHYIASEQWELSPEFGKPNLADWWKRNRSRPLWEIQVEGIDREIAFMEKASFKTTHRHWRLREFVPPAVFESHRKDNLRILKEMRASIVAQKVAYRPKSFEGRLDEPYDPMLGLPWTTNPR